MSKLAVILLLPVLSASSGCKPKVTLATANIATALVSSRTDMGGNIPIFDEPILPGPTGLISFSLQPPNTVDCMGELDKGTLKATANGTPMKTEATGGSHTEHPMGPSHLPHAQTICDPIRFTIPREQIKDGASGHVVFDVTDGASTLHFEWVHLFDHRTLKLVEHAPTLLAGEHVAVQWVPLDDKFDATDNVTACLKPGPDAKGCPASLNGSQCAKTTLEGKVFEFDVPAAWTCAPAGGLWVGPVHARANCLSCDPKVKECRASLLAANDPIDVQISK